MNQPELGRKIADLRKSKGLTQEELVEKCNLNVRTLQRIESGEVTPRTYTLKMIFAALDYNSADMLEINKNGFSVTMWLEQFYRYVLDLFNLKTNKMKKITILSIMFSAVVFGLFTIIIDGQAQEKKKSDSQVVNRTSSTQQQNDGMKFSNFSCGSCFDDNGEMIGRDVKFKTSGVTINMGLIKLNKKTHEFTAGFIKGKILQNKVELACPKDLLNDSNVKYTADKVDKSDDKILLIGNAKITSFQNDVIETDEITITFN